MLCDWDLSVYPRLVMFICSLLPMKEEGSMGERTWSMYSEARHERRDQVGRGWAEVLRQEK